MTKEEMVKIVDDAIKWHRATNADTYQEREEGELIPEGLSLTKTRISEHWRFREGNTIYKLHRRPSDNHECFEIHVCPNG
jgi:hypothetical protein